MLGPSFRFDTEALDFGVVSFDFLNSRTFKLVNTCEIPVRYGLRIPQDGVTASRKEFEVTPSKGVVAPFEEEVSNALPHTYIMSSYAEQHVVPFGSCRRDADICVCFARSGSEKLVTAHDADMCPVCRQAEATLRR